MRKKMIISVIVLAIIAGIVVAINQIDFMDTLKKLHGG